MRGVRPFLELRDATVVRGSRKVLDSMTLRLVEGEHVAILGPNGSGKSTLIKLISGQLYPVAARAEPAVRIFGRDRWNLTELRGRLGVVSSDLHQRFVSGSSMGRVSGLDAVVASFFGSEMLFLHHRVASEQREAAMIALGRIGAAALAGRRMHEMSSGEVRRVLIARALVHQPDALVLDEPTSGLDVVARQSFLAALEALAAEGTTLVLVTHHVEEIVPSIGRIVLLHGGRVDADGTPEEVLRSEILGRVYGAPIAVARSGDHWTMRLRREERLANE